MQRRTNLAGCDKFDKAKTPSAQRQMSSRTTGSTASVICESKKPREVSGSTFKLISNSIPIQRPACGRGRVVCSFGQQTVREPRCCIAATIRQIGAVGKRRLHAFACSCGMWNAWTSGRCRGAQIATSNANLDSFGDRGPLLRWLVFTGLCVFAFVLLWRFGLIRLMVASDRTYLSSIIGLLYVAASMHCLWRTIMISREGDAARRGGTIIAAGSGGLDVDGDAVVVEGAGKLPPGLVSAHIHDLAVKARLQGPRRLDQTLLLRGLAGRLRGSNQFGAFASDTLMKLGLLGTIIGFIMMLAPIAGPSNPR